MHTTVCVLILNDMAAFTELELFEDGPYGKRAWTDVDTFMENGPLTAIEIRAGDEIDGLRARYYNLIVIIYLDIATEFYNNLLFKIW